MMSDEYKERLNNEIQTDPFTLVDWLLALATAIVISGFGVYYICVRGI